MDVRKNDRGRDMLTFIDVYVTAVAAPGSSVA